jgi:hypothetical protein
MSHAAWWRLVFAVSALLAVGFPAAAQVPDEARRAGRAVASFPHAAEDYFNGMDNGIALATEEVRGRNMWLVWTGGNDRFWDSMTRSTFGAFDLLKIVSSHPSQGYSRVNRWDYFGLVNEPCFDKAPGPVKERRGLWMDVRSKDCPADPFENEQKYPGVKIGSRGKPLGDGTTQPVGSYYGWGTGIAGLRLFPNPDFDEKAAKEWDADRYYNDPSYYNRKDLVRPYQPTRRTRSSRTSARRLARNTCGWTACSSSTPTNPRVAATSCTSWRTRSGPVPWTRRWCRPTRSTTRAP